MSELNQNDVIVHQLSTLRDLNKTKSKSKLSAKTKKILIIIPSIILVLSILIIIIYYLLPNRHPETSQFSDLPEEDIQTTKIINTKKKNGTRARLLI